MAFNVRDLAFSVAPRSQTDDDRSWVYMVGCGSGSVMEHINTQGRLIRYDAVDFFHGVRSRDDIRSLRQELNDCLGRLDSMENELIQIEEATHPPDDGGDGGQT
jgi:hypothetical protein